MDESHIYEICYVCGDETSCDLKISFFAGHAMYVCFGCFLIELATLEAKDESRRFVPVAVGGKMKSYSGDRCECGRCAISNGVLFKKGKRQWRENICQVCAINLRMLTKAEAETKRLISSYRLLLKQVKEKQNVA